MRKNIFFQTYLGLPEGGKFEHLFEIAFLILVCSITVIYRWKFVVYPLPLNPDEVQAGANVLRFIKFGLSWDSLDGTTVGPLNTAVLAWPFLLGWDVTLSTIRFSALIILCLVLCATYLTLRIIGGKFFSATLLLFLVAFYSLTTNPDFQHYSSELLPLLLISVSLLLCFYCFYNSFSPSAPKILGIIFLGMFLGAVPFAKLQATPIALTIYFFTIFFIFKDKKIIHKPKLFCLFAFSGLLPAFLFFIPLILNGKFIHFWNSYIIWAIIYVKEPLTLDQFYKLIKSERLLSFVLFLPPLLAILLAFFHSEYRHDSNRYKWGSFLALILISSWFSIVRPGNMFPHYLMLFPSLLILFLAFALNSITPKGNRARIYRFSYLALVSSFLYYTTPALSLVNIISNHHFKTLSPKLFDYLGVDHKDTILVWGWMPQWYISSGLTPATRETHNYSQITYSILQDYFKNRLLSDLYSSSPALIVDAVAGKSLGFNEQSLYGIQSFDGLARFVESNYQRLRGIYVNPACAISYVRNDLASDFKSSLIKFKYVSASSSFSNKYGPEKIDDFSVTEDTCSDFWLLPNNQAGYIDIDLYSSESIKKILILNTANSNFMNHGSSKMEIIFFNKEAVVKILKVDVKPFPQWTTVLMNDVIVSDSIRLSIIAWTGNGGGINEVKVFR